MTRSAHLAPLPRLLMVVMVGFTLAACQFIGQPPAATPGREPAETEAAKDTEEPAETEDGDGDRGGGETSLLTLGVGDCFDMVDEEENVVEQVDCDDEHEYEVYAVIEADGDEFPSDDALLRMTLECRDTPFEDYVGRNYITSRWYSIEVAPTEDEWEDGFLAVVCALYDPEEPVTTGSAQGSEEGADDEDEDENDEDGEDVPGVDDTATVGLGGARELEAGDCYDLRDDEAVEQVDCGDEHQYEVFAVIEFEDGDDYPGEEQLLEFAYDECRAEAFEDYVGVEYIFSRWYSIERVPSEEDWGDGAHHVICSLYDPNDRMTTGSAEGSEE